MTDSQPPEELSEQPNGNSPPEHLDATVDSEASDENGVIDSGVKTVPEGAPTPASVPASTASSSPARKRRLYILAGAGLVAAAGIVGLAVGLTKSNGNGDTNAGASTLTGSTNTDTGSQGSPGTGPGMRPGTSESDAGSSEPPKITPEVDPEALDDPVELPAAPSTLSTPLPTEAPTSSPTDNPWETWPVPDDPDSGYFNYGPESFSDYGPASWGEVDAEDTKEAEYWAEYDEWIEPELDDNMCNNGGVRQSPIDLTFDHATGECLEYHMIKSHAGEYTIDDKDNVRFEIHPSKLRVNYDWESQKMLNKEESETKDIIPGPSADIPKGWGIHLPVLHVDIKTPSEHTIEGKRYAAEYTIFLIQNRNEKRGAPAVSVLFDFHPQDKPNWALQKVLDKFQLLWNADMEECEESKRKQRNLVGDEKRGSQYQKRMMRGLQSQSVWDPFTPEIFRSAWFFGYDGSLTEPPCTEFVERRIIDAPALISRGQLRQIQNLLFNHVDGSCRETSVHYKGSVARPLQPVMNRTVYKCNCRDYLGNQHRKWYGRNRCWEGDEHIFHEKSNGHWVTSPETKPDKTAGGVWNCYHDSSLVPPCCGEDYDPFHDCCAEGTC